MPPTLTITKSARPSFESREVPFDTLLVNLVFGRTAFSAVGCGFSLSGRKSVCNDLVYRILVIIKSVIRNSQPSGRRTQNELRAPRHDDIRSPQMLVHLHPTKQEAGIQIEINTTQRVQFEVTIDRANLVFRQPQK